MKSFLGLPLKSLLAYLFFISITQPNHNYWNRFLAPTSTEIVENHKLPSLYLVFCCKSRTLISFNKPENLFKLWNSSVIVSPLSHILNIIILDVLYLTIKPILFKVLFKDVTPNSKCDVLKLFSKWLDNVYTKM